MLLRFLKINDYRSWLYLIVFSGLMAVFALSFGVWHNEVFKNSVLSLFTINGTHLGVKIIGALLLMANVLLFDYVLTSQELTDKSNHVPAFLLGLYLIYALLENPLNPQLPA